MFYSVSSVLHGDQCQGEVSHAMVLDIFDPENNTLIFKNTYDQEGQTKQFKIERSDQKAPEELYFVHIEIKDMDNLPSQEREAKWKAMIEKRKAMKDKKKS